MSEVFKKGTVKTNPLLKLTFLPNMRARGHLAKNETEIILSWTI